MSTPERTWRRILVAFANRAAMTDDELVVHFELYAAPPVYAPTLISARSRLSKAGLLVDSGARRDSNHGRPMIVWRRALAQGGLP